VHESTENFCYSHLISQSSLEEQLEALTSMKDKEEKLGKKKYSMWNVYFRALALRNGE
jgi:hypothetical protein